MHFSTSASQHYPVQILIPLIQQNTKDLGQQLDIHISHCSTLSHRAAIRECLKLVLLDLLFIELIVVSLQLMKLKLLYVL